MARIILLACQPKSGSTYLSHSLAQVLGGRTCSLVSGYGRREQELVELRLWKAKLKSTRFVVAQHHVWCSSTTLKLVDRYGLSVVVLRRNLFDLVASFRDHTRNEEHVGPMMYLDETMLGLTDAELEIAIARLAIPWYLNFHMSWRNYQELVHVDYEEIRKDPAGLLRRLTDRLGVARFHVSETDLSPGTKTRLNKGISGRGTEISAEAKQLVQEQIRFYAQFGDDPYLRSHLVD